MDILLTINFILTITQGHTKNDLDQADIELPHLFVLTFSEGTG